MSKETTENFWKVIRDWTWSEIKPVAYRLYHDDQGKPLFYTMEDLPGTYIEVDQITYVTSPYNVKVQNGQLIVIPPSVTVSKLTRDNESGTTCAPQDVCVVVTTDQPHQKWKKHTHDID